MKNNWFSVLFFGFAFLLMWFKEYEWANFIMLVAIFCKLDSI